MQLSIIETGQFKLDGGAMFGVVPKRLWNKKHPSDEQNLCNWSMRCLLVEANDRKILIDTGLGNKQDAKFRSHFQPFGEDTLLNSLKARGIEPEAITDVLLTHLHFDHVGGAVIKDEKDNLLPTFPNAIYWSNKMHYDWAYSPNPRERASFLKENFVPLQQEGRLRFLNVQNGDLNWLPNIKIRFVHGHTRAMMLPIINYRGNKIFYCADLLPSNFHIGLPYVMSYDVEPLKTIDEKSNLLQECLDENHYLFFEHDPTMICAEVHKNEKGRIVLKNKINPKVLDIIE